MAELRQERPGEGQDTSGLLKERTQPISLWTKEGILLQMIQQSCLEDG